MADLRLPRIVVLRIVYAPSQVQILRYAVVTASCLLVACWIGWTAIALSSKWTMWLDRSWAAVCWITWVVLGGLLAISLMWSMILKLCGQRIIKYEVLPRKNWQSLYVEEVWKISHVCSVWGSNALLLLLIHLAFFDGLLPAARRRHSRLAVEAHEWPIVQQRVMAILAPPAGPAQAIPAPAEPHEPLLATEEEAELSDILQSAAAETAGGPAMTPVPLKITAEAPAAPKAEEVKVAGNPIPRPTGPRRFVLIGQAGELRLLPRDLQTSVDDLDAGRTLLVQTQTRAIQIGEWYKSGRRVGTAYDEYLDIIVRDFPGPNELARTSVRFPNTRGGRLSHPDVYDSHVISWLRSHFECATDAPSNTPWFWWGVIVIAAAAMYAPNRIWAEQLPEDSAKRRPKRTRQAVAKKKE